MQANNNIIPQHRSDVPEKDAIVSYGFFSERLVQLIPSVVFVVNIQDEKIVFANNRVEELLGYEKGDLDKIDHNFIHLVHPDDRILIMSRIKYLCSVKIDTEDSIICRLQHQSGKYIHHCLHVTTISHGNYDDKITSILIIAVENKEEEGVLQELDKARELTKEVEKILGFGTYEWDIDAGIFRWSEGLYHIFGYENNVDSIDVTIDFFLKHIAPEDIDRLSNLAKVSLELKQSQEVEYNIITADNKHKMLSSLLTKKITNEKGDIIKIIGATRDITLIKVYEDQLQRQMDNLSKSNKDLEEFAYIASHDLQEPLRKISTFSGKLASKYGEALGEDGNMFIERVLASADNMRTLIDNLLEFSRITKGEQSYTETSLNFIVQQVLQQLELSIEETSAEINIGKLPVLQASPTQLKQVFDNIIRNAIKFRKKDITPKIGISSSVLSVIEKEVHKLSIGTVYHKIFIEDNGIGFESEYASRIFQIFQRLHGKSQYPGSGIGLAICKKIVENHHGLIFAENIPSSGARFIIILPERQTQ